MSSSSLDVVVVIANTNAVRKAIPVDIVTMNHNKASNPRLDPIVSPQSDVDDAPPDDILCAGVCVRVVGSFACGPEE